ncbi:MAG: response regulator [Alphaproteobacteria bacterium]|nr:response regulator [Alphaproteobacteria bacterium]
MARILIIEDDRVFVELMSHVLSARGHEVQAAANGVAGSQLAETQAFDAVVCDLVMPDQDGIATIRVLRKTQPDPAIIAISGGMNQGAQSSMDYLRAAQLLGADASLKKPFLPNEFVDLLEATIARVKAECHKNTA